jgi:hypothetical protein
MSREGAILGFADRGVGHPIRIASARRPGSRYDFW